MSGNYRALLKSEFKQRVKANPHYSLRAFARDLDIAPSRLSEIFSKKQGLSADVGRRLAKKLGLGPEETELFCGSIEAEHSRSQSKKAKARENLERIHQRRLETVDVSVEQFEVVSDPLHFAILESLSVQNLDKTSDAIADFLGVGLDSVKMAVQRLEKVSLVEEKDGVLNKTGKYIKATNNVPSDAVKKYHQEMLENAKRAIWEQDILTRELHSLNYSFATQDLPKVRELLATFKLQLRETIEQSSFPRTDLYSLNIQFFKRNKLRS